MRKFMDGQGKQQGRRQNNYLLNYSHKFYPDNLTAGISRLIRPFCGTINPVGSAAITNSSKKLKTITGAR
jgi:hypothetical protein